MTHHFSDLQPAGAVSPPSVPPSRMALPDRAVDQSDSYRLFFQNMFPLSNTERTCSKTAEELRQENRLISHTSMDGMRQCYGQFPDTSRRHLHMGVLSVPVEMNSSFLANLATSMNQGAHFYLSEVATPVHPVYLDVDMNMPLSSKCHVEMALRVIRRANFDWTELEQSNLFTRIWKFRPANTAATSNAVLYDYLQTHVVATAGFSWLDIFEACINDELRNKDFVYRVPSQDAVFHFMRYQEHDGVSVPDVFITLFLMAITKLCIEVIRTFFPTVTDAPFDTFLLGNRGPAALIEEDGCFKVGAHIHIPDIRINIQRDLEINQGIVKFFTTHFQGCIDWTKVFDNSVYARSTSGLRMPFCYKAKACKCARRDGRSQQPKVMCPCNGTFHLEVARYYAPRGRFTGTGDIVFDTVFMQNKPFILHKCSLRTTERLTEGYVTPDGLQTTNLVTFHRVNAEERFGAAKGKALWASLAKEHHIQGPISETEQIRLSQLFEAEIHCKELQVKPKLRKTLLHGDPRFEAIAKYLPIIACHGFDVPDYRAMDISSVILVQNHDGTVPSHAMVFIRGRAAQLCFNRVSETARGRMPGQHQWTSVYFHIQLNNKTLTQKCSNSKIVSGSAFSSTRIKVNCCRNWEGQSVVITPALVGRMQHDDGFVTEIMQNMFFLPEEQTREMDRAIVAANALRRAKNSRKRKAYASTHAGIAGSTLNLNNILNASQ